MRRLVKPQARLTEVPGYPWLARIGEHRNHAPGRSSLDRVDPAGSYDPALSIRYPRARMALSVSMAALRSYSFSDSGSSS